MTTITTVTLPCDEFALSKAASANPEAIIRCWNIVEAHPGCILPVLWTSAPAPEQLEAALQADQTTIAVEELMAAGNERLYRIDWADQVHLLIRLLTRDAILVNALVKATTWTLELVSPPHETRSETAAYWDDHDLSVTIRSIREISDNPSTRYGLTAAQYETLRTAFEQGCVTVPRDATFSDISEKLGRSPQAISERYRRGMHTLIQNAFFLGAPADL